MRPSRNAIEAIKHYGSLESGTGRHAVVLLHELNGESTTADAWWACGKKVYLVSMKHGGEGWVRFTPGSGTVGEAPYGGSFCVNVAEPLSKKTLLRILEDLRQDAPG